jgi:carbamoylphosphate synthase large subunit
MKILFIGARLFDDVALYARKKGITTILTESNPQAAHLKLADSYHVVSRGMENPKEIALKEDVDAVVPLMGVDGPLPEIAMMKEELESVYNLPVITSGVNATSISGDKLKTKEFLTSNGIKTPEFRKISENSENILKKENILKNDLKGKLPLVLKKSRGQGGSGVKIVSSSGDVDRCLAEWNDESEIFIEKFMEGVEVSIEVLRYNNESVPLVPVYKGNTTLEGVHPLKKVKKAPLNLEGVDNQQNNQMIMELADRIAQNMGTEGTMDIDIIFDTETKENYVIEMNTRPSGTRYITAASTGINPIHELVDMASGEWKASKVKKSMKNFSAFEIPVGSYRSNRNNYKFRDFPGENSWIVHGPENYERVTIRGKTCADVLETAQKLGINLHSKLH